jgi:hypothetical protein
MSHITQLDIVVHDLDALERAAVEMGFEFVRDCKKFRYYAGTMQKCDHVIRVPGTSYEVGVSRLADGTYTIAADFWGAGGLTKALGENGVRLMNHYGVELAKKHYAPLGFALDVTENEETGEMTVVCNR